MKDSMGIREGQVIPQTAQKCTCEWETLMSNPPQFKLLKKCGNCHRGEHEKHNLALRGQSAGALVSGIAGTSSIAGTSGIRLAGATGVDMKRDLNDLPVKRIE